MIWLENMRKIIKHCIYIYIIFCLIRMWKFASLKNNTIVSSFSWKTKDARNPFISHSNGIPEIKPSPKNQSSFQSHPNDLAEATELQPLQVWSMVAIYKWYISGIIYCQSGDYMPPTTFYGNQKQPLIWQWRNKHNKIIFSFHTTGCSPKFTAKVGLQNLKLTKS